MSSCAVMALTLGAGPGSAACIGTTTVDCTGTIATTADSSSAVEVQESVPAGAGSNGNGFDGTGSAGGNGQPLSLGTTPPADISTQGVLSHGVLISSGGGAGGEAMSNGHNGTAGAGGSAGSLTVVMPAGTSIATSGNSSYGIYASNLGGIGGPAVSNGLIGVGGSGGAGGAISITFGGTLTTQGDSAMGIYALSRGAQGGEGRSNGHTGAGGNGGVGGLVDIEVSGTVSVQGDGAIAISAASSGGTGGGAFSNGFDGVGGAGGNGGAVSVTTSGIISASGVDGIGIVAESARGYGGTAASNGFSNSSGANGVAGNVTVNVTGGSVTGGSGVDGFGVWMNGGAQVTLTNAGTISALSGKAVRMTSTQDTTVNNSGTIIGDVALIGPNANFNNLEAGRFESGASMQGYLYNNGTLAPGGADTIKTTAVTGNLVQAMTGRYEVDADWVAETADKVEVAGTASLAGTVIVNPLSFPSSTVEANGGLNKTFTILTATGGVTDNGLVVNDTAAVDYTLVFNGANTLDVNAKINFLGVTPVDPPVDPPVEPPVNPEEPVPPTEPADPSVGTHNLTNNQTHVGTALNTLFSGGNVLSFMGALLGLETQEELADGLDQLAPEGAGGSFVSTMSTGNAFGSQLLSCRTAGEAGDGNAVIREGQCLWARASVRELNREGGGDGVGFEEQASFYSAGAQVDLGGDWRLGGALGFETSNLETASRAVTDTDRVHVGGILKYNPGPLLLAASVTGGHGWSDNERIVAIGKFVETATSDSEQSFVSGRLTGAYLMSYGQWYAKPQVDVSMTYLERDGYTEAADGGIALAVHGSDDTVVQVSPSLEIGAEFAVGQGGIARPYVKGGVTWLSENSFGTTAEFADAPSGVAAFTIASSVDDVVADVGAGVDFIGSSGTALRLQYDGRFGETTTQHGGSAKLSVPF